MPFPNEHSARVKSPELFKDFARKNIRKGIDVILGIKESRSEVQSYRFKIQSFTVEEAKKWLADNKLSFTVFEKAIQAQTKKVQSFFHKIQALSKNDILNILSKDVLAEIKQNDAHPFFQAYSIAHEGDATPTILGDTESKPIKFLRKAIESIKNVVTKGVKFFIDHNEDSSIEGRFDIGEVVADTQQEIDGKLHHIVIGYFPPETKKFAANFDICSQEGDWDLLDGVSNWIADKINGLTGIALLNSESNKPAFSGAQKLATLQAKDADGEPSKGVKEVTFHELKQRAEELNVFPHQLFDENKMKQDNIFGKTFMDLDDLKEKYKVSEARIKELEAEKEASDKKQTQLRTVDTRLQTLIDGSENPLTDKQKMFVKKTLSTDSLNDLSDDYLKEHIKNQLNAFQVFSSLETAKGTPSGDTLLPASPPADPEDYTDPKNNELL